MKHISPERRSACSGAVLLPGDAHRALLRRSVVRLFVCVQGRWDVQGRLGAQREMEELTGVTSHAG